MTMEIHGPDSEAGRRARPGPKPWFRRRSGRIRWQYRPDGWQAWALIAGVVAGGAVARLVIDPKTLPEGIAFMAVVLGLIGVAAWIAHPHLPRDD